MSLLDIFFPDLSVRYQKQKSKIVAEINEKEKEISNLPQSEFPKRIKFLKEQIKQGFEATFNSEFDAIKSQYAAEKKAKRQKILDLMAKKQDAELESKSYEELAKELEALS